MLLAADDAVSVERISTPPGSSNATSTAIASCCSRRCTSATNAPTIANIAASAAPTATEVRRTLSRGRPAHAGRGPGEPRPQADHPRLRRASRVHAHYIADCMRQVYAVKVGRGEIRRVNINAAPLDHAGYAIVKAAGIGIYQIFQETYHHETYRRVHPRGHAQGRLSLAAGRRGPGDGVADATTWASARCSGCTTGGSRCSRWWPMPGTCRSTTAPGRTRSAFRGCAGQRRAAGRRLAGRRRRSSSGWWPCCGWRCLTRA